VVGYEREVTAEAGYRVGLSAGAKVVHVADGPLDRAAVVELLDCQPDVVLLVGGTDGGNSEVLLHNAQRLATSRLRVPVVLAGNVDVRERATDLLSARGNTVLPTANVLPEIGVLDVQPARAAIREVFIKHVIGGKGLSRGPRFGQLVRAATPDAVLAGVELLADGAGEQPGAGDVLVIDVGGATTDVYSVVTPEAEEAELRREVVEVMWRSRTVEGDLGVRWNAEGIVAAAVTERLVEDGELAALTAAARMRSTDPAYLPETSGQRDLDARLAALAVTVALRRHARTAHKSLRRTRLVVGSGGVLRHANDPRRAAVLAAGVNDRAGGWQLPEAAELAVDARYVLAAAGLLGMEHPQAAAALVGRHLAPLAARRLPG
jgi:uncharacterized protein (TIGR01319 family)